MDLDTALTTLAPLALHATLLDLPRVRKSELLAEVSANGRSPLAREMARKRTARRRIVRRLKDAIAFHPETLANERAEAQAGWATVRAQSARRKARRTENAKAIALDHCPRCVNGYIPNMPVDGGICYRCYGSGRA
jgi:hypothetical protein